jgi:hypothetical protein
MPFARKGMEVEMIMLREKARLRMSLCYVEWRFFFFFLLETFYLDN